MVKLIAIALAVAAAAPANTVPRYALVGTVPLGSPDRWDYVVFDAATRRVYVAHGNRLAVIDADTARLAGEVTGIAGVTHGTAVSPTTGQGFTDDGEAGTAIAFDLRTLKITHEIPARPDADGIALDPVSGHVFVVEGDPNTLTVIDPRTDRAVATINAGEKLEYAAADGEGSVYVAGEGKGDVLRIDARRNRISARWPTPGCASPHGIAIDSANRRVFMGCVNRVMMVVDGRTGRLVGRLPIGGGSDAVAYDPVRRRVFSSNGADGTITVYQQVSPDRYTALEPVTTSVSARTMSVDPRTGRLFVAAAETDPNPFAGARPKVRPGTLKLLVFEPRS